MLDRDYKCQATSVVPHTKFGHSTLSTIVGTGTIGTIIALGSAARQNEESGKNLEANSKPQVNSAETKLPDRAIAPGYTDYRKPAWRCEKITPVTLKTTNLVYKLRGIVDTRV